MHPSIYHGQRWTLDCLKHYVIQMDSMRWMWYRFVVYLNFDTDPPCTYRFSCLWIKPLITSWFLLDFKCQFSRVYFGLLCTDEINKTCLSLFAKKPYKITTNNKKGKSYFKLLSIKHQFNTRQAFACSIDRDNSPGFQPKWIFPGYYHMYVYSKA